ncbi:acetyl-CoA synthetase-like protein [Polychaeton citri CBS 116435]|uniref:Acetyl-CoA synthetase-like protein n=1 Tax=Polychaeton citri CBS 116435 TaxID=1314669 RepID=A0A9P4QGS4_9PEZI|nr:acetyl-CoA synthetase-like protein [Polychaeton citri CBS 116435]
MHLATPLVRFAIVEGRKMITTIHHAISDHYALKFLFADAWRIYRGQEPAQHTPFKKFVEHCDAINETEASAFWKTQFKDDVPAIFPGIPLGRSVKASQKACRNITLRKIPSPALMPAYIEAAWSMTAADYTGNECIAFGYVMSGRSPALAGAETTLGPTITTVPMQIHLKSTMTIQQLLKSRNQSRRVLATSPSLQFGMAQIRHKVSEEARIASGFQTVLNILHQAEADSDTPGLTLVEEMDIHRAYGLVLTCTLSETGVLVKVAFDETVLPDAQMQRILRQLEHRLKALTESPPTTPLGQLQRLNFGDTLEIMEWNKTIREPSDICLHDLFTSRAVQTPDDAAVDAWDGKATYRELNSMANCVAQELMQNGISAEEPIPFVLERSLLLVVTVLGIMKAGGTCVPIDISHPRARKEAIINIAKARIVLTSARHHEELVDLASQVISLELTAMASIFEQVSYPASRAAYIMFTSGSTGLPKGVVLEHRSLASSFSAFGSRVGWTRGTRVLQFAAPAWDACALEMLGPLMSGGCVCIPSRESRESGLVDYIVSTKVDFAIQTPTALRNLSPEAVLPSLKTLMSAGEPIPLDAANTWGSKMRLFNGWGPCETSVCAAMAELNPTSVHLNTIGTPVGSAIWIVDSGDPSKLMPIGVVGEMLVEGPGVAREYLNEPTKTAASFISPPPFVPKRETRSSQKLYRTGDLARYNPDGSITFLGRQDNQIKMRGQRFELGEVEEVLTSHNCVRKLAVTTCQSSPRGPKDLVAVLSLLADSGYSSPSHEHDKSELRQVMLDMRNYKQLESVCGYAQVKLPSYMVPTAWLIVTSIPLMASTKIDRVKIRDWVSGQDLSAARDIARGGWSGTSSTDLTTPTTAKEAALQSAWSSVLAIAKDRIGRESSFVRLGGDSITAMQVATRCRKQGFRTTVAALLRNDTLAGVANETETLESSSPMPTMTHLTLSDLPFLDADQISVSNLHGRLAELGISQDNVESIYPCTAIQEGILFAQLKAGPDGDEYRDRFGFKLSPPKDGEVDAARVISAWKAVCEAHPILRTIFIAGISGQSAFQQIVLKQVEPSVSSERMPADCTEIAEVLSRQTRLPSSQERPPHHLSLYQGPDSIVYAVLNISHAVVDARTMQAIWEQIGRAYSHGGSVTKGRNFSDYVAWLQGQKEVVQRYWRTYLAEAQPCLFPRDPVVAGETYETRGPEVPFKDARGLHTFCQCQGITIANFMQAAWGTVLRLYTGLPQVYFGCLRSEQDVFEGAADILGPLVTMLVCKTNFEDPATTALHVIAEAQEDAALGLQHSGCSLAQLHDDLGLSTSPLFDTILTIQHAWANNLAEGDEELVIEPIDGEDPTEYSILVNVHYSKDDLFLRLSYQRARFSSLSIQRVAETFAEVIQRMIENPKQALLQTLGPKIVARESSPLEHAPINSIDLSLLKSWNATTPVTVEACIPHRVRAIVRQQPNAPAVCSWDRNLNYGQLDTLSDCLALKLREDYGVKAETIVPFACEKSASAVVILLAISKAGGAFLPLDISHSRARLMAVLEDTDASLVLVNSIALDGKMRDCTSQNVLLVSLNDVEKKHTEGRGKIHRDLDLDLVKPSNAAYAVYTSGSTGKPKGIMVDHSNIATSAQEHTQRLGITAQSRMLQLSNFTFDVGLGDIVYALVSGACLCMPSEKDRTDDIAGAINRMEANFIWATPTHATLLTPEDTPTLQTVALIGEPVRQENIETWAPHVRLINSYGPAETAVMTSCRVVSVGDNSQDIGHPSCCRYWIVNPDDHHDLLPIGTTGELLVEGPLVARGYINNREATAAAFIDPPAWTKRAEFSSSNLSFHRFYKTGDLIKQVGEKSFIYEGRKDSQIKIRGQRIELGEIEYHLNRNAKQGWHWVVEAIQPSSSPDACLAAFFEVSKSDAAQAPATPNYLTDGLELRMPLAEEMSAAKESLKSVLPIYMVPDYFIHLGKIPTTSSMKTDRKSLRAIAASMSEIDLLAYRVLAGATHSVLHAQPIAAKNQVITEDTVFMQQAWAGVLNVPAASLSACDDFFSLGGNSIRAMHLVARLRKAGHALSVTDVFKSPVLVDMVSNTSPILSVNHMPTEKRSFKSTSDILPDAMPRLVELAGTWSWLESDNIESIAPATDTQNWMLAVSNAAGHGFHDRVILKPASGHALDLIKLQKACLEVIRQQAILRTVFVRHGTHSVQVALRNPPVEQVHIWQIGRGEGRESPMLEELDMIRILPQVYLDSEDGSTCNSIELRIHHALYDAMSMGHILEDLRAAYAGQTFAKRPSHFHEWISHISAEETTNAQEFWKAVLRNSISRSLTSSVSSPFTGNPADSKLCVSTSLENLHVPQATAATVLKAAWSFILSQMLEEEDVIFGYVSANRYSTHLPGVEQIAGPCINVLPVRARASSHKTFVSLVADLQQQSNKSIPHQHIGFCSIVRDCTQWPSSRYNSIIVFQNHESLKNSIMLGDTECTFTGEGQVGDSADMWLTAMPQPDGMLVIDLHYSSANIPSERAQWISGCLKAMLNALPALWTKTLDQVTQDVFHAVGNYPASRTNRHAGREMNDNAIRPDQAGEKTGLLTLESHEVHPDSL